MPTMPFPTHQSMRRWSLARIIPIAEIELKSFWHLKSQLLSDLVIVPAVYLALLAAGLGSTVGDGDIATYLTFVLPGFLMMQAFGGFQRAIFRATIDRRWGLLALKRLLGAGGLGYVLAMLVVPIISLLAKTVAITVLAIALGVRMDARRYITAILLTCIFLAFWTSLATILTSLIRTYEQRDIMLSLLILPITFSAPVFYALEDVPRYLRIVAFANPLSYQVMAVRRVFNGEHPGWWLMVAIVATVVAMIVAVWSVSRSELLGAES